MQNSLTERGMVNIFTVTHKPIDNVKLTASNSMYIPIQVGSGDTGDFGYLRDNQGENISELNSRFSELTAMYYIYKNINIDYVGIQHYRRVFAKKSLFSKNNIQLLEEKEVLSLLKQYDILLPRKQKYYIETLYTHYSNTFDNSHIDKTREIIESMYPDYVVSFDNVMSWRSGYMFNMLICDKKLFDSYCEWLFPILFELQNKIDESNLTPFELRLYGRISELLLNVWVHKNELRIKEINVSYIGKINYFKKIIGFLKAKFFGVKYKESF